MELELINSDREYIKEGTVLVLNDGEYDEERIVECYIALQDFNIYTVEHAFREALNLDDYLEEHPKKYELFLEKDKFDHVKGIDGLEFNYKDYIDDFVRHLLQNKYMKRVDKTEFCFNFYQGLYEFIKQKESGWEDIGKLQKCESCGEKSFTVYGGICRECEVEKIP